MLIIKRKSYDILQYLRNVFNYHQEHFPEIYREEAIEYNFKSKQGCGVTVHSFIAVCVRKHVSF